MVRGVDTGVGDDKGGLGSPYFQKWKGLGRTMFILHNLRLQMNALNF